jgi:4-hydroxybenzoate polyprenyltransferase
LFGLAALRESKWVIKTARHFLELIRFSHTIFALPFALLAAVMAWHRSAFVASLPRNHFYENGDRDLFPYVGRLHEMLEPRGGDVFRWQQLVGLLLCMLAARSFAMAVNRLADRHLDAQNPRTAGRHLPAGILDVGQVIGFAAVCAIVFILSTLWFLPNWLPLALSAPVLAFLAGYSYAKRFTSLSHVWLGAALGLSPVATWIALRGDFVLEQPYDLVPSIVLGAVVITWVAGFDIIYACQDCESDRRAKLHSVPVKLGISTSLRVAALLHTITILLLVYLPFVYVSFGAIYWAGVAAVAVLLVYEHLLVRPDDLSRVNAAFFNVNAVISLGLFAVGTLDLLVGGGGY